MEKKWKLLLNNRVYIQYTVYHTPQVGSDSRVRTFAVGRAVLRCGLFDLARDGTDLS